MIVVDIESSGVVPHIHSILGLGALDLNNPDNRLYLECRAWEGAHLNKESMAIGGYTEKSATDREKITEAELVREFDRWVEPISERTITGQNPSFDRDFLQNAYQRAKFDWPLAFRTIDTHTLAYMHMVKRGIVPPVEHNRSALDLDAVLNYVGIPDEPMPHNALTGALSHAEVANRLLYDKKLLPEFEQFDIPWLTPEK